MITSTERHDLWRTRLYYLLWFGGNGFSWPFLNLFFLHIGLTGTQIGWIASIGAIVTLIAAPFWTGRSDQWKHPRTMLQFFMVINAVALFLLSQQTIFLGVAAISIMRAFFGAGIMPLSDSFALTIGKIAKAGFGSVRVFGSLGWVIFVPISGWLVEQAGLEYSLVGAGVITFASAFVLFQLRPSYFKVDAQETQQKFHVRAMLQKVVDNPLLLGLGIMIVVIGIANSGVQQFEMTYMRQLGARESLIGIAGMLGATIELPFMFVADYLIRKRSAYPLLMISMLMYACLRILVFTFPSVPMIMVELATAGIAYSFLTVGIVRFIGEQTLPNETRMMLAFFTVTLVSLTSIVGAPLAGNLFDRFGAHWLYGLSACGYLLAWVNLQFAARSQSVKVLQTKMKSEH